MSRVCREIASCIHPIPTSYLHTEGTFSAQPSIPGISGRLAWDAGNNADARSSCRWASRYNARSTPVHALPPRSSYELLSALSSLLQLQGCARGSLLCVFASLLAWQTASRTSAKFSIFFSLSHNILHSNFVHSTESDPRCVPLYLLKLYNDSPVPDDSCPTWCATRLCLLLSRWMSPDVASMFMPVTIVV